MHEFAARAPQELQIQLQRRAIGVQTRTRAWLHYVDNAAHGSRRSSQLNRCQTRRYHDQTQYHPRSACLSSTQIQTHHHAIPQRRWIQISTTPSSTSSSPTAVDIDVPNDIGSLDPPVRSSSASSSASSFSRAEAAPDARFEVLGQPLGSLLSVSLSASQELHTRRGTLVGLAGAPENTYSSLSPLQPVTRIPLGIPFLYQRVVSSSPTNLLVAPRGHSAQTTFSVLQLDGRTDWMVTQRAGLVAWTGRTLQAKPVINTSMTLAHWGNTMLTGRGLVALAGKGQIFQLALKQGETYVVHPANLLAYSISRTAPAPYRFKTAAAFRLQIPSLRTYLPESQFVNSLRETAVWKWLARAAFALRTWARRTIWADRLFLSFHGPATLLVQSRGSSVRAVLTDRDVNDIADAPAGAVRRASSVGWQDTRTQRQSPAAGTGAVIPGPATSAKLSYATVSPGGRVHF